MKGAPKLTWLRFDADGRPGSAEVALAAAAHRLLVGAKLPPLQAGDGPTELLVAERNGVVVACGGFEPHGDAALLRSVAVTEGARGTGLGRWLVERVLDRIEAAGAMEVYLLTEGAAPFFRALGFRAVPRAALPRAVGASRQLRGGCCSSATAMELRMRAAAPDLVVARAAEGAEAAAWIDLFGAAPPAVRAALKLRVERRGEITLFMSGAIPAAKFNFVSALGVGEAPASAAEIEELQRAFHAQGIRKYYIQWIPSARPREIPKLLASAGMVAKSAWERIVLGLPEGAGPRASWGADDPAVTEVDEAAAPAWAEFICAAYGFPAREWLLALVGRPGWHHYQLHEEGTLRAVRSAFVPVGAPAWLGIDAPVPGIMAPSYAADFRLNRRILPDAFGRGATAVVTDIEAPDDDLAAPAYRDFARLGFRLAYRRQNYLPQPRATA